MTSLDLPVSSAASFSATPKAGKMALMLVRMAPNVSGWLSGCCSTGSFWTILAFCEQASKTGREGKGLVARCVTHRRERGQSEQGKTHLHKSCQLRHKLV